MDYEQRYKEILEWARKNKARLNGVPIEDVLPELAESEDERMLEKIISYLEMIKMGCVICTIDTSEEIAWLEKQKEQEHICDSAQFEEGFKTGYELGLRKWKERKPAEWSEEDERMLSRCVKSIESSKQFADSDTFKKAKDNEIDWLKNRFKFLHPQAKVELSEEDEKMIDNLIRFFNEKLVILGEAENAENTVQYVSYKKVIDWLKSLRPSWKPSEEHLSALLAVFNDPDNIGSQTCQLALTDLYEQLKKL